MHESAGLWVSVAPPKAEQKKDDPLAPSGRGGRGKY